MSMITATSWVPRGHAAAFPTKYVFDEDEYGRIAKLAKLQLEDAQEDLEEAREAAHEPSPSTNKTVIPTKTQNQEDLDDDLKEYDLENYDDDDDDDDDGAVASTMGMFGNIKSLAYHETTDEDPYITLDGATEEDEERDELQILPKDNLLLAARIEETIAHLEIYVYEDDEDNLYVHHDIMLPAYPLCVEWLNSTAGREGAQQASSNANYVAVGTMDPDIEVWDLDTVDCMYPNAILGKAGHVLDEQDAAKRSKKKKKNKSRRLNDEYHVDAVLSLAANKQHRNLLASSSADTTVKLWDVHTAKCAKSYQLHADKVCSVAWNAAESTLLLTGSYDKSVTASDMRAPGAKVPRWTVESDVESVAWDPHRSEIFYVSTESGLVHCYDVRRVPPDNGKAESLWSLQAHDEGVSAFHVNPVVPGLLVTGSTDKTVKLWNVDSNGPSMVVSRNLDVGKVFSAAFAPDTEVGFRLAVAGSKGTVRIWDTSTNAAVRRLFADKIAPESTNNRSDKERLIGLQESSGESDEEGGGAEDMPDDGVEEDEEEGEDGDTMKE